MAGRLIDISPLISERIGVWPGDVAYERTVNLAFSAGNNLDLSSIQTTVHLGAHTDAPNHYMADGAGMHQRNLERYIGPCQVIDVDIGRGERILPSHLSCAIAAPRVLFRTGTFPDPDQFNTDFASLSAELVHLLARHNVILVGLDTPSVDLFSDGALLSHNAIASHDMGILEGVILGGVSPGIYELIALPLNLENADASPVRAVLRTLG
jgi:arylformamidase